MFLVKVDLLDDGRTIPSSCRLGLLSPDADPEASQPSQSKEVSDSPAMVVNI